MSECFDYLTDAIDSVLDLDIPDERIPDVVAAVAKLKAGIDSCD